MKINYDELRMSVGKDYEKVLKGKHSDLKDLHEDHFENFSKYHSDVVKNIEKELNRSKRL